MTEEQARYRLKHLRGELVRIQKLFERLKREEEDVRDWLEEHETDKPTTNA